MKSKVDKRGVSLPKELGRRLEARLNETGLNFSNYVAVLIRKDLDKGGPFVLNPGGKGR